MRRADRIVKELPLVSWHRPVILFVAICMPLPAPAQPAERGPSGPGPNIRWPVEQRGGRLFQDSVAVIEPQHHDSHAQSDATLVTYSDQRLQSWDPVSFQSRWPKPIECPYRPQNLLIDPEKLVFATPFEMFAVDRRRGVVAWRLPIAAGTHEPSDLVDTDRWTQFWPTDKRILAIATNGNITAIDPKVGNRTWDKRLIDAVPRLIGADQDVVYGVHNHQGITSLHSYALGNGLGHALANLPDENGHGPFEVTQSGPVVFTNSVAVALDADGNTRWKIPLREPIVRRCFTTHNGVAYWLDLDGRLTSLDLQTGRIHWTIEKPRAADADWLVVTRDGSRVIVGKPGLLIGVDTLRGTTSWRHSGREHAFANPPIIVGNDILVSYRVRSAPGTRTAEDSDRLRLQCIEGASGMASLTTAQGDIVTGPIERLNGIAARKDSILILDGHRLIGYVSTRNQR